MKRYLRRFFNILQKSDVMPLPLRIRLLNLAGAQISSSAIIGADVDFLLSGPIQIGEKTFINRGVLVDGQGGVTIGRRVHIAPRTLILTSTHELGPPGRRAGRSLVQSVEIGDGAWIGASATVLPGVRIAENCVIAAGSIVTKDTEPDYIYTGVPAKRLRRL